MAEFDEYLSALPLITDPADGDLFYLEEAGGRSVGLTWASLKAGHVVDWTDVTNKPATYPPDAHDLEDHTDVVITTPSVDQALIYTAGAEWVNGAVTWNSISGKPATYPPDDHYLTDHQGVVIGSAPQDSILAADWGTGVAIWRDKELAAPAMGTGCWTGTSNYVDGGVGNEITETLTLGDALNVSLGTTAGRIQLKYTTSPVPVLSAAGLTFDITVEAPANNIVGLLGFSINGASPIAIHTIPYSIKTAGDTESVSLTIMKSMADEDEVSAWIWGSTVDIVSVGITIHSQTQTPVQ